MGAWGGGGRRVGVWGGVGKSVPSFLEYSASAEQTLSSLLDELYYIVVASYFKDIKFSKLTCMLSFSINSC